MTFYERLQFKIKEKGETIKSTEKQCGMANATIQKWQKQSPRLENIEKVALFLNVSLDWLVFGTERIDSKHIQPNTVLPPAEQQLLDYYHAASSEGQVHIMEQAEFYSSKYPKLSGKSSNYKIG